MSVISGAGDTTRLTATTPAATPGITAVTTGTIDVSALATTETSPLLAKVDNGMIFRSCEVVR